MVDWNKAFEFTWRILVFIVLPALAPHVGSTSSVATACRLGGRLRMVLGGNDCLGAHILSTEGREFIARQNVRRSDVVGPYLECRRS